MMMESLRVCVWEYFFFHFTICSCELINACDTVAAKVVKVETKCLFRSLEPIFVLLAKVIDLSCYILKDSLLFMHLYFLSKTVSSHCWQTFWGCEFLSPGKSCLELLTDFYIDLTQQKNHYMHHW